MAEREPIRLCRMHPSRGGRPIRCIGRVCGYHTSGGWCLISPNPPSRWQGRDLVIEVPADEYANGERGNGETDGGISYGEVGPSNSARLRRPDLSDMPARQIQAFMDEQDDWS